MESVDHVDQDVREVRWTSFCEMVGDMRDIQEKVHEDKDADRLHNLVSVVGSLTLYHTELSVQHLSIEKNA